MKNEVICTFIDVVKQSVVDLEVPLYISCDEFVKSINKAMKLNIEIPGENAYFRSENPIGLIKGEKKLSEIGLRSGSVIFYERRESHEV